MSDNPATEMPSWVVVLIEAIRDAVGVPPDVRCLSRNQAARALSISVRKLDQMAATNSGPPSIEIGGRRVYPTTAIKRWLNERIEER